ncbi:hypothetical protein LTR97_006951 [Elasticomyces elasticus]|uniref:F-box domain-containing protein n=1 Tax=Elasticomyces elasticus TaxID=574655 RepID=A0AAN7W5P1_9PEZI|nr:hypothetical protein LTR97_006951 [Elasticomyces elasticus]
MSPKPLSVLPPELLIRIAESLDTTSLLGLRRCCSELCAACESVIKDKYSKLYLHPTNLPDVLAFCEKSGFAASITELVLLGKSTKYMTTQVTPDVGPSDYNREQDRFDDRPWPQVVSNKLAGTQPSYTRLVYREKREVFAENYEELYCALRRLPAVSRFSYAGGTQGPGFCQVSDVSIQQQSTDYEQWISLFGGLGQPNISHAKKAHGWSDAEVATSLLMSGAFKFMEVNFQQPLPCGNGIKYAKLFSSNDHIRVPCKAIESLTVTVPGARGWMSYCKGIIDEARDLATLKIIVASSIDGCWKEHISQTVPQRVYERSWEEEARLWELPWQLSRADSLADLTITGISYVPDVLSSKHIIDLCEQQKNTLRSVRLDDVFFANLSGPPNVQASTKSVLSALKELPSAANVSMNLRRLDCKRGCSTWLDGEHGPLCERYNVAYTSPPHNSRGLQHQWRLTSDTFDDLAVELGAPCENGRWDFAHVATSVDTINE